MFPIKRKKKEKEENQLTDLEIELSKLIKFK